MEGTGGEGKGREGKGREGEGEGPPGSCLHPGFELDRNAPERRSGSFFKTGTAFRFIFLKIPNENQIAVVAYIQVCFHPW